MMTTSLKHHASNNFLWIVFVILSSGGLLLGFEFGNLNIKWLIYLIIALVVGTMILASGHIMKALMVLFILGLQVNVSLYLTEPYQMSVGNSGPTAVEVRFILLPALILLIRYVVEQCRHNGLRFFWGLEISLPAAVFFLTTASTGLYSSERALVLYQLIDYAQFYCIFLVALNMVRTADDVRLVLRLLMVTLAIQAIVYFIQNALGVTFDLLGQTIDQSDSILQRHGGTVSSNAKGYANFVLPLVLLALARFLLLTPSRARFCSLHLVGLGGAALILTFTRATWIGFVIGTLWIVGAGVALRVFFHARRLLLIGGVGLLVTLLLLPKIMIRLSDNHEEAYNERAFLMQMAWNVIAAHPILGVGSGAYGHVFRDYLTAEDKMALALNPRWLYIVHNAYLLRWAETGALGLLSLLLLLGMGFRQTIICTRLWDETFMSFALGWGAGLLGLAWEMFWDLSLGPQTLCLLWFLLGLMLAIKRIGEKDSLVASVQGQAEPSVHRDRL